MAGSEQRSFVGTANIMGSKLDVQVVWSPEFDRQLTATVEVNNFFDRNPPSCFSCSLNGFEGTTYDVPGVFGYLSATYYMQ